MKIESKIFFNKRCPKCGDIRFKFTVINCSSENNSVYVEHFHNDDWRTFDFEMFSISSLCDNCKNYVSANIAVKWDPEKNKDVALEFFANENGELIESDDLIINFDIPALLPAYGRINPMISDTSNLLLQAERCYAIHAWDAVGMLCRKIIDIDSARIWKEKYGMKKIPNLFVRLVKLFIDPNFKENDDFVLDYSKKNHKLFYALDRIRDEGNGAAHSHLKFDRDDAEGILVFTRHAMEKNWS